MCCCAVWRRARRFVEIFQAGEYSDATNEEIRKIAADLPTEIYLNWAWLAQWTAQTRVRKEAQTQVKALGVDAEVG